MQLLLTDSQTQREPKRHGNSLTIEREVAATTADTVLEFGRFRVLPRQRQILVDGEPLDLGGRAFDLLLALIEARGSLVSKDELLRRVWPSTVVEESNLKVQISVLRRALGTDRDFIQTDFGRGYRFTAAVRAVSATPGAVPAPETGSEPIELSHRLANLLDLLWTDRSATLNDPRSISERRPRLEVILRFSPAG